MIFMVISYILLGISIALLVISNIKIEKKLYSETLLLGAFHRLNKLKNAKFTSWFYRDRWESYLRQYYEDMGISLKEVEVALTDNPFVTEHKSFDKYVEFLSFAYKELIQIKREEKKYLEIKEYDEGVPPCFSL